MRRLKIHFVSHGASAYGAERSLVHVVVTSLTRGHDIAVFLPGPGPLHELLTSSGVPENRVREQSNRRWLGTSESDLGVFATNARILLDTARFVRIFRRERPDVVMVNSAVAPAAMFAARVTRRPVVTFVREAINDRHYSSTVPKAMIWRQIRAVSSSVVCNSRFTAGPFGGHCQVIPPPIEMPARHRRRRPTSDTEGLRLLMVGRITAQKGQLDLVEAIIRARDEGHEVVAELYGDDIIDAPYAAAVRARLEASRHGNAVRLHPFADEIAPLYDDVAAAVVASPNEAFGRVTVEALQCGVPVIGYDAGGTSEILEQGGGLLVPPHPDGLHAAIVELCRNPAVLHRLTKEALAAGDRWRLERSAEHATDVIEDAAPRPDLTSRKWGSRFARTRRQPEASRREPPDRHTGM